MVNINARANGRRTPFYCAAVMKLLLATRMVGVSDASDKLGPTPLRCAAANRHEGVGKLMLKAGVSGIDARDAFGGTPLYRAAENGHEGVLKLLLETGMIDIDAKEQD